MSVIFVCYFRLKLGWDCSRKETVQGQRDHTSLLLCCCCEILGRVQCGVTHFTIWVPLWQVKATQPGEINSRNVLEWKWTNIGGYFIPCFISWLYKHHHLHGFIIVLLLCEEILRLWYRCMQTSCLRERWTSSLSVKPIVQHGIFTIQMWQGFMNQTIPKPSKGCKIKN